MNKENILLLGILGILIILMANNVFADVTYGAVSDWNLDDSNADGLVNETGGVVDFYGLNNGTLYGKTFNHGTNNGATWSNSSPVNGSLDKFGGYYEFDGVSSMNVPLTSSYSQGTLSLWYNAESDFLSGNKRLIGKTQSGVSDILILGSTGGNYRVVLSDTVISGVGTPNVGEWTNIALSWDGSNIIFYENGIVITNTSSSEVLDANALDMIIGANNAGAEYFNGLIDEIKLFSKALTQAEIQEEMNSNAVANPEGIVAYYDFNEDGGSTVYDNNHLTTGARQSTSSIDDPVFSWDKAMNFDGVNDYVDVGDVEIDTEVTLSTFFKQDSHMNQQRIISKWTSGQEEYIIFITSSGYVGCGIYGSTSIYTTPINSGWNYVTCVMNLTKINIYLNGNLVNSKSINEIAYDTTSITQIGRYEINNEYFNGSIADVRIYDRALTEDEVSAIYYAGDITDFDSNSATYNNITTSNLTITPDEGEIVSFETEITWATSIKWFLDGVLQKIGNAWDWYVGVYDAGKHTITTIATNDTYTASYETIANVQDVFPLSVTDISPKVGVYDVTIYATCFINDSRYWFKNSTFDFQLYYNNGTSTDWRLMGANVSKPDFPIFVEQIPNQQNVQLRCRSGDGLTTSDWSNVSTNLTINHPKNKIVIKDLSGIDKKSIFTNNLYQTECKFEDNYNITQLSNIFVDCNNDGLWDDMKKIYADDVKEESFIYSCEYEESGVYYMSTGCVYEKTDEDSSWQIPNCKGLPYTENYCVSRKMIEVMIYSPSEVLE